MYDFSLIAKNCNEVGNKAALETLEMGIPVTSWDEKRQIVIKIYPNGYVEDVKKTKAKNG